MKRNAAVLPLILVLFLILPAFADGNLASAIQTYNQRKYMEALTQLRSVLATQPNNATARYYTALCFQAMNQMSSAMKEYEWLATYSPDPTLKGYAQQAIRVLGNRGGGGSSTSAPLVAQAGSGGARKNHGRCKVILFETDWCHYCKEFAPRFDAAKSQYGSKMDFQRLDADAPANAGIKQKYGINSFPRLVYLDGSGNLIYNEGRSAFDRRLQELTGP